MSIARHSLYNLAGAILPVAVSIVTVPLYLKTVGLDRYGVLNLCWLLVGYFGFFDFGLGRATAQKIATLTNSDQGARSQAFWNGMSLSAGLALIALVVAVPVSWLAFSNLKFGSPPIRNETLVALPLLIASVPCSIVQSVLKGSLEGRREFLAVNSIMSAGAIATGVIPLAAALIWGPTISLLVAASLGVRVIVLAGLAMAAKRAVPVLRYQRPRRSDSRHLLRFGAWLTVTNVVGPMMVFFDRFLIGAMIGAAAVGLYAIPFNLVNQMVVLPAAIAIAMFPRLAANPNSEKLKVQAFQVATFVMTILATCGAVLAEPFLGLWLGYATAAQCLSVAIILIFGVWANGIAQIPFAGLQALGRTDLTAKAHLGELVPYALSLWLGLKYFGIAGGAAAWSARAVVDLILLSLLDRVAKPVLGQAALQGTPLILLCVILLTLPTSPIRLALVALICLLIAAHLLWAFPKELREKILQSLTQGLRPGHSKG